MGDVFITGAQPEQGSLWEQLRILANAQEKLNVTLEEIRDAAERWANQPVDHRNYHEVEMQRYDGQFILSILGEDV